MAILAIALLFALSGLGAQGGNAAPQPPTVGPIDLVLLMDDSASVLQWSKEVDDFLLGPFLRDYLRLGDTFHLLSFGAGEKLEMVRTVSDESDVKAILAGLFLLYPIQRNTDFIGATDDLTGYLRGLDATRKKLVVIVTDGVQDPPAGSPRAGLDAKGVASEVERSAKSLRSLGWPVRFVMLPFGNDKTAAVAPANATAAGTSASASRPIASTPASDSSAQASAANSVASTSTTAASSATSATTSPTASPTAATRDSTPSSGSGAATTQGAPVASVADRAAETAPPTGSYPAGEDAAKALNADVTAWPPKSPATTSPAPSTLSDRATDEATNFGTGGGFRPAKIIGDWLSAIPGGIWAIAAAILIVLVLVLLVLFAWLPRRARGKTKGAIRRVARSAVDASEHRPPVARVSAAKSKPRPPRPLPEQSPAEAYDSYVPVIRKRGRVEIEFRVLEQNSHIGRRNVHSLQAGQSKTIGGKHSDYLIFLVSVPAAVAELHFDGETCVFVPRDRKLFPDLGGPVEDCLDRDIPMLSPRGYPLTLRFSRWEEPTLRINKLLRCIMVQGLNWDKGEAEPKGDS